MSQGISVVDGEMRLVAWNRRYSELFDYPDGMLFVGRPVADLMIRYKRERGQIGPVMSTIRWSVDWPICAPAVRIAMCANVLMAMWWKCAANPARRWLRREFQRHHRIQARRGRPARSQRASGRSGRTTHLRVAGLAEGGRSRPAAGPGGAGTRTRFIAAASHDLLRPLSPPRLFLSSLRDDHA